MFSEKKIDVQRILCMMINVYIYKVSVISQGKSVLGVRSKELRGERKPQWDEEDCPLCLIKKGRLVFQSGRG